MTHQEFDISSLHLTNAQRALSDAVQHIPKGRWSSYDDLGEAMARRLGRGSARGAASAATGLRKEMGAALGISEPARLNFADVGKPFGFRWWCMRNAKGLIVHGGGNKERSDNVDHNSIGNVMYRAVGGAVAGGGYAPQIERFCFGPPEPVAIQPICDWCFLRPCQCETA